MTGKSKQLLGILLTAIAVGAWWNSTQRSADVPLQAAAPVAETGALDSEPSTSRAPEPQLIDPGRADHESLPATESAGVELTPSTVTVAEPDAPARAPVETEGPDVLLAVAECFDSEGMPIDARVRLELRPKRKKNRRGRRSRPEWETFGEATGRRVEFQGPLGKAERARLRIVDEERFLRSPVETCAPGESVRLTAQQFGSVEIPLRLDPEFDSERLRVTVRHEEKGIVRDIEQRVDRDRLELLWVTPGLVDIELSLTETTPRRVLFELEDVLVLPGRVATDPRLVRLDLSWLRPMRIVVRDERGEPLESGRIYKLGRPRLHMTDIEDGEATLLSWPEPHDFEIVARGLRPHVLERVNGDREVVLERGLSIALQLPYAVPRPPMGFELRASVIQLGEKTKRPGPRLAFDATGEARVRVSGPGRYKVRLWLAEIGAQQPDAFPGYRELIDVRDELGQTFELGLSVDAARAGFGAAAE